MSLSLLAEIHEVLTEAGIAHALIGAAALAVHGHQRATSDSDLLTTSWRVLEPEIWSALRSRGVEVTIRRGDDDDPLAGVIAFDTDSEVVDIVVGRGRWQTELLSRAELAGDLPVVSLPDLVLLKLHAGGRKDRADVAALLETMAAEDVVVVEGRLHVLSEWSRAHWDRLRAEERSW